ncbi:hypothetical protein QY96_02502 [Bacillus thermotolerans]|nr:hypothetical protein QY96_02502 [Bacillus thermotolerans]
MLSAPLLREQIRTAIHVSTQMAISVQRQGACFTIEVPVTCGKEEAK